MLIISVNIFDFKEVIFHFTFSYFDFTVKSKLLSVFLFCKICHIATFRFKHRVARFVLFSCKTIKIIYFFPWVWWKNRQL